VNLQLLECRALTSQDEAGDQLGKLCLIPYILPNSCERFAGARVLPFNSCSLQAAIIN